MRTLLFWISVTVISARAAGQTTPPAGTPAATRGAKAATKTATTGAATPAATKTAPAAAAAKTAPTAGGATAKPAQAPAKPSPLGARLAQALKALRADPQMTHAIYGFYIKDSATGKAIWDENSQTGLAPASCQKVIVSTASLELLGEDFQYQTRIGYDGSIQNGVLRGNLYIIASGDPSLGSWRYAGSRPEEVMEAIHSILQASGITRIEGNLLLDDHTFPLQPVPRGWVWEDLGNYYGAGAQGLNWHENQYDLDLEPGDRVGDSVRIVAQRPALEGDTLLNELTTGPKGSGDQSNIYWAPLTKLGYVNGSIPADGKNITIAGSIPDPGRLFINALAENLKTWNIALDGSVQNSLDYTRAHRAFPVFATVMGSLPSPSLDSLVYWFLKKSINLYGEALARTLALQKTGTAATDTGVSVIRDFWIKRGVERTAFHIQDGSGLSPQNRVTAFGLVQVLEYARKRPWFRAFYDALPVIDGMTMKSGSIGGARAYAGYVGGKDGRKYTFAFIINNYDGNGTEIQHKMWKILDELK
ncbi:D-alanyl-D-alanine carboxypeptidase/D-alanyl-D-alanine endopeptidase [Dinghuibacter silviterrae]|nr:D-alanyl-D-alanine carboxypeptidase/D-alanyl-D-alanine-endopeptidase [Dinghuibacter silviterrae]